MSVAQARYLRRNMTDAERRLWRHLRMRDLGGCRFRRQRPVGPYVVDFACLERSLIVEIDGGQHNDVVHLAADQRRTEYLQRRGFRVVRFWNNEVFENLDGVCEEIRRLLEEPPSRPSPAARGKES
ncbi:MAG: endonuclease domain-containing protein [Deltaproteobacteria bacterium]|nr:endonuclease domain-containing protein [Deltaproteobacteria bacterium]